jgi:hypothetical protein
MPRMPTYLPPGDVCNVGLLPGSEWHLPQLLVKQLKGGTI